MEIKKTTIYQTDDIKLSKVWNETIIEQPNQLLVLPYLKEKNEILCQYKEVLSWQSEQPLIDKWIQIGTVVAGNEVTISDVFSACKSQFGLMVDSNVQVDILAPIYIDSKSTKKIWIVVVELLEHQYEIDVNDMIGSPIRLNCSEMNNYIVYDIQTRYIFDLFKKEWSLFK